MSDIRIENIPQTWDDTNDVAFFRIVTGVFPTEFVFGAGVLLGSYDEVDAVAASSVVGAVSASPPISTVPVASPAVRQTQI